MNFERYTEKLKLAIQEAQSLALANGNINIMPEHLLVIFLDDEDALLSKIIALAGGNVDFIKHELDSILDKSVKVSGNGAGQPTLSQELARILIASEKLADKNKDKFVTVERVLQAMLDDASTISNISADGVCVCNGFGCGLIVEFDRCCRFLRG